MPCSDLNDFIYLDKELKRLKEDNLLLKNENQELLSKIKLKNIQIEEAKIKDKDRAFEEKKIEIEKLKEEIIRLKKQIEIEKDQHQQDLINTQNNFQDKICDYVAENKIENKIEIDQLKNEIEMYKKEIEDSKKQYLIFESNLQKKEEHIQNLKSQVLLKFNGFFVKKFVKSCF